MKKLFHVYCFESGNYFKSKSFVLSTLLICVLAVVGISLPGLLSGKSSGGKDSKTEQTNAIAETMALYDPDGFITDELINSYGKADIKRMNSEEEVKESVRSEESKAGFVIHSNQEYDYYVFNQTMSENSNNLFSELMSTAARLKYCEDNNLNYDELIQLDEKNIVCHENILGKDSRTNYFYSYILVILVFFVIVMYGMMIATSVANEKSNRTVEILVTSTSSSSLLFGKVLAGATAILFQLGLIFSSVLGAYHMNRDTLGGMLDMLLDIPADVCRIRAGRFPDLCFYVRSPGRPCVENRRFEQECRNRPDARYDHLLCRAVPDAGTGRHHYEGIVIPSNQLLQRHVYTHRHGDGGCVGDYPGRRDPLCIRGGHGLYRS